MQTTQSCSTDTERALTWLVMSQPEFHKLKDVEYELNEMGIKHEDRMSAFLRHWNSTTKQALIRTLLGYK